MKLCNERSSVKAIVKMVKIFFATMMRNNYLQPSAAAILVLHNTSVMADRRQRSLNHTEDAIKAYYISDHSLPGYINISLDNYFINNNAYDMY